MNPHDLLQQLPPLQAPPWLKGGHAQTLYAKALQSPPPAYRRELLPDSYGEDLAAYDFVDAADPDAPLVVLFHGLEGSSTSHYAVELMHRVRAHGWHGVVAHFRSCGGVASKRLYHSGDTREAAHMLALLAQRYRRIYAVGVSLGGNVLANRAAPPCPPPRQRFLRRSIWAPAAACSKAGCRACSTRPILCTL